MKIDGIKAAGLSAHAGAQSPDAVPRGMRVDQLTLLARQLYFAGPYVMRKMMHYRIGICPFERLLPHVPPGSSVLDVGCGAGLFLALLAGTVTDVSGVGFDSSWPAIQAVLQMTEQVRRMGLRADLRFIRLDVGAPCQPASSTWSAWWTFCTISRPAIRKAFSKEQPKA